MALGRPRHIAVALLLVWLHYTARSSAIRCYNCQKDFDSCNEGQCTGLTCIKIEMANDKARASTRKGCNTEPEEPHCFRTVLGQTPTQRCVCDYDFCNGDKQLTDSGLEPSNGAAERSKRTGSDSARAFALSANHLILLVFLCLFVCGSFSLLLVNSVCVHLC